MSDADAAVVVGGGDVPAPTVTQPPADVVEAQTQATPNVVADPVAVAPAPPEEKIANGTDAPSPAEEEDDAPFELKHLIENRAAFKRLKDEIEGDIVRIDRDIAAHRAAYKKARSASSTEDKKVETAN